MKRLLIIYLFLLFGCQLSAQEITWTGAADTTWTNIGNWSPSGVPTPCNRVIIPAVATNKYPSLVSNIFVDSLVMSGGYMKTNQYGVSFVAGGNGIQPNVYTQLSNGDSLQLSSGYFKAQTPNLSYSLRKSTSTCAPTFRFEIKKGENWPGDTGTVVGNTTDGNRQNGAVKERAELYHRRTSIPMKVDVWVSYSVYIEPGDSIKYGNTDYYCMLGQWHPGDGVPSGGPSWAIELSEIGKLNLITRGQDTLVPPFTGGQPKAVDRGDTLVTRGEWHHIVVRARHDKSFGQIDWWVDGKLIHLNQRTNIPIGNDHSAIGYWKFGIYRTTNVRDLAVRYANVEVSTTSLLDRVTTPLSLD